MKSPGLHALGKAGLGRWEEHQARKWTKADSEKPAADYPGGRNSALNLICHRNEAKRTVVTS